MKVKDLRQLTNDELLRKVNDFKDELFRLRFQLTTGQLDNPMRLKEVRRSIARAKTVLTEREMQAKQG